MVVIASLLVLCTLFLSSSGQSPGDLRLWQKTVKTKISEGRLQIYVGGEWSEVCSDGFQGTEADVACHQLGYVGSVYEEAGSGDANSTNTPDDLADIGVSGVYCQTNDYLHLLRCHHQLARHSCSGKRYVQLTCNSTRIWDNPYQGQIRLVLGKYISQGLAQIYCFGGWGTICADYPFGQNEADTVCRQLGYTSATDYGHLSLRGNYSSPILLSDIDCPSNNEQCLGACKVCSSNIYRYCSHYDDLTVQCDFNSAYYKFGSNVSTCEYVEGGFLEERPRLGEVRMYPQTNSPSGIAELSYDSSASSNGSRSWSRICVTGSDSGNQYTADTFCTQLGYSGASSFSSVTANSSVPHLTISCSKKYLHLFWCRPITVVVSCTSSLSVECYHNYTDYYTGQVRLRGGDYPSEGRVEMYVYGVWSSIYTSYYSNYKTEADSVCRQLGYTGAVTYGQGTIPGNGTIYIITPYCYGETNCFSKCLRTYDFNRYSDVFYSHYEDLSVNCTFNISSTVTVGSKDACEIDVPPTPEPDNTGLLLAILLPCLFVFLMCFFICLAVCCSVLCMKKSSRDARKRRQRQFESGNSTAPTVGYNPQGEGGVYMIPANQVPSGGLLLMPTQSQPQSQSQTEEEEEKSPPKDTDEYFPTPANTTSPDPTSV